MEWVIVGGVVLIGFLAFGSSARAAKGGASQAAVTTQGAPIQLLASAGSPECCPPIPGTVQLHNQVRRPQIGSLQLLPISTGVAETGQPGINRVPDFPLRSNVRNSGRFYATPVRL